MPATDGTYANNEKRIYDKLISAGLNTAAACGILANLYAEGGFNPQNVQNSYEYKVGNDATYTSAVNAGGYSVYRFSEDSVGYGIAQWTYRTRKRALYDYAMTTMKSTINNLDRQIEFLLMELQGTVGYSDYKKVWTALQKIENTAAGAYDAGYMFCKDFENPKSSSEYAKRGASAQQIFWSYYSSNPTETITTVSNKGLDIISIAKNLLGKPYKSGGNTPDGFDSSGFVQYCYTEAGVPINNISVYDFAEEYGDAKSVDIMSICAADLLFYLSRENDYIAIADGEGGCYYIHSVVDKVVYSDTIGSPSRILRILADSETSQGAVGGNSPIVGGLDAYEYTGLTSIDPYAPIMSTNISTLEAEGFDYGYLVDMTNGGIFKFYIPEFSEQAGANWESIDIRGRSVTIQSYNSTSSRVISISLDLYAGVGLYKATSGESGEDTISRLHKDAFFVKSLEYPDYSYAIIQPPPTVHLILGAAINIAGVVSGVKVDHMKPFDESNRAMYIKLSFTVTQTAINPIDYRDVREGQYALLDTTNIDTLLTAGVTIEDEATNVPIYTEASPVEIENPLPTAPSYHKISVVCEGNSSYIGSISITYTHEGQTRTVNNLKKSFTYTVTANTTATITVTGSGGHSYSITPLEANDWEKYSPSTYIAKNIRKDVGLTVRWER